MTLDQIRLKIMELGVSREWLAEKCHYSKSSIVNILAPGGSNRSGKALARIAEVLTAEEKRRKDEIRTPAALGHRVYLEPTDAQFDRWMTAVYSRPGRTFDEWAKAGLSALADSELELRAVAEDPPEYHVKNGNGNGTEPE